MFQQGRGGEGNWVGVVRGRLMQQQKEFNKIWCLCFQDPEFNTVRPLFLFSLFFPLLFHNFFLSPLFLHAMIVRGLFPLFV